MHGARGGRNGRGSREPRHARSVCPLHSRALCPQRPLRRDHYPRHHQLGRRRGFVRDTTLSVVVRAPTGNNITRPVVPPRRPRPSPSSAPGASATAIPKNVRGEFKRLLGTAHAVDFPAAKRSLRPEEKYSAEVLKSSARIVRAQYGFRPPARRRHRPCPLPDSRRPPPTAGPPAPLNFAARQAPAGRRLQAIVAGAGGRRRRPCPVVRLTTSAAAPFARRMPPINKTGCSRRATTSSDSFLGGRDFDMKRRGGRVTSAASSAQRLNIRGRRDGHAPMPPPSAASAACLAVRASSKAHLAKAPRAAITLPRISTRRPGPPTSTSPSPPGLRLLHSCRSSERSICDAPPGCWTGSRGRSSRAWCWSAALPPRRCPSASPTAPAPPSARASTR